MSPHPSFPLPTPHIPAPHPAPHIPVAGLFAEQTLRVLQDEMEAECDYRREAANASAFRCAPWLPHSDPIETP